MKINKLSIGDFGKLSDVSITLDPKITVISGKNEAGKSSIASFIKYMLYGFSGSRSSSLSENEKKKYMPWEAESCNGEMLFTSAEGKQYRAARKTAAKSQSVVFDSQEMPTDILCAGEHFLGVDESCFKKTAFIGESDVAFSDSGELDEAIRNMVYSADEGVDSAKAVKKLDTLRRYYLGKNGKSGEIYKLDCEISELEDGREKWQNGHKELMSAQYNLGEISKKIAFNAEQKKRLEKEQTNLDSLRAKNILDEIQKLENAVRDSKNAFEEHFSTMQCGSFVPDVQFEKDFHELLKGIDDDISTVKESTQNVENAKKGVESVYSDRAQRQISLALEEQNMTGEQVLEKLKELKSAAKKQLVLGIIFTVLLITIPVGIVFFIKRSKTAKALEQFCEKFGCKDAEELENRISGVTSFRSVEKSAKDILKNAANRCMQAEAGLQEKIAALKEYAEKCGFETGNGFDELFSNAKVYHANVKAWLEAQAVLKQECNEDYVAYKTLAASVDLEETAQKAAQFDQSIPVRDESVVKREIAFYTQANEALSVKERELEKTAAVLAGTLPKPSEITSRIIALSGLRDDMKLKHEALEMAISCLESAAESMKKQAAPLITQASGELFSKITDGKYTSLFTDSGMNLTFASADNPEPKESGYLSTGTQDAAYISLRIALCKYLYKEAPVLVFDDAFSHMDDQRLKSTLDYLTVLSEEFQIVILSCHSREKEYFAGKAKVIDFEI